MEYISAEEFLKQPEEVQKVFLDWWEPSVGDLYSCKNKIGFPHSVKRSEDDLIIAVGSYIWEEKSECIPLLTEGQLRKFIEDKTDSKVEIMYLKNGYSIRLSKNNPENINKTYSRLGDNLLQAYWKVALEVAKE